MIAHAIDTPPDDDVAVRERNTHGLVATLVPAEEEDGRDAKRHGDDGRRAVPLVLVPLKDDRHPLLGGRRINLTFRKAG